MTITPPPRGGLRAVDFTTAPYPGVPTDMQPQLCVLNACAEGVAIVRETVFESRWSHVPELRRMGVECDFVDADGDDAVANANANANANAGRALRIVGVGARGLRRADVRGSDLRASAALIVAGLAVIAPMGDGDRRPVTWGENPKVASGVRFPLASASRTPAEAKRSSESP